MLHRRVLTALVVLLAGPSVPLPAAAGKEGWRRGRGDTRTRTYRLTTAQYERLDVKLRDALVKGGQAYLRGRRVLTPAPKPRRPGAPAATRTRRRPVEHGIDTGSSSPRAPYSFGVHNPMYRVRGNKAGTHVVMRVVMPAPVSYSNGRHIRADAPLRDGLMRTLDRLVRESRDAPAPAPAPAPARSPARTRAPQKR